MRRIAAAHLVSALVAISCSSAPTGDDSLARAPEPASMTPRPTDRALGLPFQARFVGRILDIPGPLRREMRGTTWKAGCPVPLTALRLLRFNYWDLDGEVERGPMVVHREVAEDLLWVFRQLFAERFPIWRVALANEFVPEEFEERTSTRRGPSAAFNCRTVVTPLGPGDTFSQHAYGLAVDINPVQNPFVTADGFARNRKSLRYLDRERRLPGMIHDGDIVVRSFAAIGWSWGGHWSGGKDYMHFSRSGG
jgi:hypothetical protein